MAYCFVTTQRDRGELKELPTGNHKSIRDKLQEINLIRKNCPQALIQPHINERDFKEITSKKTLL